MKLIIMGMKSVEGNEYRKTEEWEVEEKYKRT